MNLARRLPLALLALTLLVPLRLAAQAVQTFNASGTWTAPAGVATVRVQAWGAGGGGSSNGNQGGGGGGGGAYASATVAVVPGVTYTVTVGAGGAAGVAGGFSQFDNGAAVRAAGGGAASGSSAGAGGGTAASVGSTRFAGGGGGTGQVGGGANRGGGGGGGSATATASGGAGNAGSAGTGGTGGTGTGPGGRGGNDGSAGVMGTAPGGGGGGAGGGASSAGAGAAGRVTLSYIAAIAEYRFDEATWNGGAGEVTDSSGNGYNANRGGSATTASGSPAYSAGSSSTCGYGRFDPAGAPRAFVQLPAGFPAMSSSFAVTAWVRTTNIGKVGQRVLVRDDNDNGWALSVSDEVAGTLRFFNRSIAYTAASLSGGGAIRAGNVALDTPAVMASNTWYFVAVSADLSGRVITLYVYNAAGTQLARTSAGYTGTWGAGSGATSIGNETSASGENGLYFSGNIDELRVFQTAVAQADIEAQRTQVRTCPVTAPDHVRIEHASGSGLTCTPATLTLRACANADCSLPYTSGVSGTLSAGAGASVVWPDGAAFSIPAGQSSLTTRLQLTTPGTVLLGATVPAASDATRCNFGNPSCSFSAADAGFLLSLADHRAETSVTLSVSAVRKSDNATVCVPAFASVNRSLSLSCGYQNPATGTKAVRVAGTALNATGDANAVCGTRAQTLSFDANGRATAALQYADVGRITVNGALRRQRGDQRHRPGDDRLDQRRRGACRLPAQQPAGRAAHRWTGLRAAHHRPQRDRWHDAELRSGGGDGGAELRAPPAHRRGRQRRRLQRQCQLCRRRRQPDRSGLERGRSRRCAGGARRCQLPWQRHECAGRQFVGRSRRARAVPPASSARHAGAGLHQLQLCRPADGAHGGCLQRRQ